MRKIITCLLFFWPLNNGVASTVNDGLRAVATGTIRATVKRNSATENDDSQPEISESTLMKHVSVPIVNSLVRTSAIRDDHGGLNTLSDFEDVYDWGFWDGPRALPGPSRPSRGASQASSELPRASTPPQASPAARRRLHHGAKSTPRIYDGGFVGDNSYHHNKHQHILKGTHHFHAYPEPMIVLPPLAPVALERVHAPPLVQERSCPADQTMEGDFCVGIDVLEPRYVCPPSAVATDGRCLHITRPQIECSDGERLIAGHKCQACDLIPANFSCPDPTFTFDDISNCCTKLEQPGPLCPPNFTLATDQTSCVQEVPTQDTCPAGYKFSTFSGACTRESIVSAETACPEGMDIDTDTDKCSVTHVPPPRCPEGFTFISGEYHCIAKVPQTFGSCPSTYSLVGSECERHRRLPAEFECPVKYSLDIAESIATCVRHIPAAPTQCPEGYIATADGPLCERRLVPMPTCQEPGATLQYDNGGSYCEVAVEHTPIAQCPAGMNLTPDGESCEVIDIYREVKRYVYPPQELSCPSNYFLVEGTRLCTEAFVRACVERHFDACVAEGKSTLSCNLQALCPEVNSINIAQVPAEVTCPSGNVYDEEAGVCVDQTPSAASCGSSDRSTDLCSKHRSVPVKMECPSGTARRRDKCISFLQKPPDFTCPPETEAIMNSAGTVSECVEFTMKIKPPPSIDRLPAIPRCTIGTLQTGTDFCLHREAVPVEMVCPGGAEEQPDGTCAKIVEPLISVPITKIARASHVCPTGTFRNTADDAGATCVLVETAAPLKTCPSGAFGHSGICLRRLDAFMPPPNQVTADPRLVCPSGSELRGTSCVVRRTNDAKVTCPAGFDLETDRCVKAISLSAICPPGTTLGPNGCEKKIVTPVFTRVMTGCQHDVRLSCPTCPRSVQSTCQSN